MIENKLRYKLRYKLMLKELFLILNKICFFIFYKDM